MSRRYDVALFDLDGTIADTLPLIYEAFDAAFRPLLGKRFTDSEIRQMFGPPDHEIIRQRVPPSEAEAAFLRYLKVYRGEHERLVRLFDGIEDVINRAAAAGMRMAIITGKSRETAIVTLEALGVMDDFGVLYGGDDVERFKPDPQALHAALRDLQHEPHERVVMIGDSAMDIMAGKAAGVATIAVRWGSPDYEEVDTLGPDAVVESPSELAAALSI